MKKIILALFVLVSLNASAQKTTYYNAYYTYMTQYNDYTSQWDDVYKNTSADINISVTGNIITFHAEKAITIKTYPNTGVKEYNKNYSVTKFKAYDVSREEEVGFDVVKFTDSGNLMMVIRYTHVEPAINLHYFIK
jgi:hypothetical protein